MNAVFARLVAVLAVGCMVTGCSVVLHRQGAPVTTGQTPTTTTLQPSITCPAGQRAEDGSCVNCPQLKPCFNSPAEMHILAAEIYPAIEEFSASVLDGSVPPARWYIVAANRKVMTACEPFTSMSGPMFCNHDDTIYLGEDGMWDFYNTNDRGDAINVVVMAHEWGHHVQMHMGAMAQNPTLEQMQKQELQADCISGAAAQFMHQKGYFSDDDLSGVLSFMPNIPSDKYGTHGTNQQRMDAFQTGYSGGMSACNPIGVGNVTPM